MLLRATNGVLVDASETATPKLLAEGWCPVVRPETTQHKPQADLSALTVAQLRELCAERGVDAPRRATKAQLVALLN